MNKLLPTPKFFLFDTNVWITAYRRLYAPDVFPGLWQKLKDAVKDGIVACPQEVIDEIVAKDDKVARWVWQHKKELIRPLLESNLGQDVADLMQGLKEKYPRLSYKDADYSLLAWGKEIGCTVVTLEKQEGKNKIPEVGKKENVKCIALLEFMRLQEWKF